MKVSLVILHANLLDHIFQSMDSKTLHAKKSGVYELCVSKPLPAEKQHYGGFVKLLNGCECPALDMNRLP